MMTTTTLAMMTLLDDAHVRSFGEPGRLFEPPPRPATVVPMKIQTHQKKSTPILTALVIALPLSLLGGGIAYLMTQSLGNALTATAVGLLLGLATFLVNALTSRSG
ncbi:hypothetical protein [Micrococcus aloeverae]